jgi:hypothetical protein
MILRLNTNKKLNKKPRPNIKQIIIGKIKLPSTEAGLIIKNTATPVKNKPEKIKLILNLPENIVLA